MKSILVHRIENDKVTYFRESNMVDAIAKVKEKAGDLRYAEGRFGDDHFIIIYRDPYGLGEAVTFMGIMDEF